MQTPGLIKTFVAAGAVAPRRIVAFGAADGRGTPAAAQAAAATDALFGVSDSLGAAAGTPADITLSGLAEVEYGGDVAAGDLLTADAQGRAVAAARHTHEENLAETYTQEAETAAAAGARTIGIAMMAGVAGDIGSVHVVPGAA